ncbi:MAG: hypothetical protein NTW96_21265, partial [Planctomycetia bacterium]|nr:hypothetical protein [Planctomycetia bacterium]
EPEAIESPLGIRPFQAYQFVTTPFSIRLAASPVAAKTTAQLQTVLKIAEHERNLESRVRLMVEDRPIYRAEILLPEGFNPDEVSAPGVFHWAITAPAADAKDPRRLLTVYFGGGQQGEVAILLRGKLARAKTDEPLTLPRLAVVGARNQEGDVAVQADPAIRVEASDLKDCETVLLDRLHGWLQPEQRGLTRLALHHRGPDYSGRLSFSRRAADVACTTITNVRVTDRAVEETLLLDFTIREAGIRRLSLLVPSWMSGCRVNVPMLRQWKIEPVGKEEGSPLRITIDLQDEVMDQLRVLVQNDRLLTPEAQRAPIPVIETGETTRRFVALESAGRDEVVVDEKTLVGMELLNRKRGEWQMLRNILGDGITQTYLVGPGETQPRLEFRTREREAVETAGAKIGLAKTDLMVDANGAYRGRVEYRLDNRIEQFLQIELPHEARLWTAQVAGEPVKPIKDPDAADERHLLVPLVKTAPGDLDYAVVLVYGGKLAAPGSLGATSDFPLVTTVKLTPEQSQVRLYLPRTHRWFDFGGKMRRVHQESELAAEEVAYNTKVAGKLLETMRRDSGFAQVRAAHNLGELQSRMAASQGQLQGVQRGEQLEQELVTNAEVLGEAQREAQQIAGKPDVAAQQDNRGRLMNLYADQKTARARNQVKEAGSNFMTVPPPPQPEPAPGQGKFDQGKFDQSWFDQNSLTQPAKAKDGEEARKIAESDSKKPGESRARGKVATPVPQKPTQPAAPSVTLGDRAARANQPLADALEPMEPMQPMQQVPDQGERGAVSRYQQKLQQKGQTLGRAGGQTTVGMQAPSGMGMGGGMGQGGMQGAPGMMQPGMGPQGGKGRMQFGVGVQSDMGAMNGVASPSVDGREGPMGGPGMGGQGGMGGMPGAGVPGMAPATAQDAPAETMVPSGQSLGVPAYEYRRSATGAAPTNAPAATEPPLAAATPAPATSVPAGLASLEVTLPEPDAAYYDTYLFTTPRGEVEITARAASSELLSRLAYLAVIVLVVIVSVALLRERKSAVVGK